MTCPDEQVSARRVQQAVLANAERANEAEGEASPAGLILLSEWTGSRSDVSIIQPSLMLS